MSNVELAISALAIVCTIVTTTTLVLRQIAHLEVMIAKLQVELTQFETRIKNLENRDHEHNLRR